MARIRSTAIPPPPAATRVAVVAFDGISPFHLSVPCVVFGDPPPGAPGFVLDVCAAESGPLRTSAGFEIVARHGLAPLAKADIVIVPSWRDPAERPPAALLQALVKAHRRGAVVVGLCIGAFVLAEAGLLAQRRATTHWACADDFAARFPEVRLDPDVLYVEDGGLVTSAGTAAGIDCCLHLLRSRHGSEAANRVARRLVVPPHRQGGQRQFIDRPVPATRRDSHLGVLLDEVRATLDQPHSLDTLAARAALSRRSFTRHFRKLTGSNFGDWLLGERLGRVQQLLESSDHGVEAISALAGFGSPVSLRLHFRKRFGVAPSDWRQTFRGNAG
jgi:transcriptional regulator GlxA family with amidase domain